MAGIVAMLRSGLSTDSYYTSMNEALKQLKDEYTMLHYPYYVGEDDDFMTAQKNLTDFCLSCLPSMQGKSFLEIGCGNGIQSMYIYEKESPSFAKGIDLNIDNIKIARSEAAKRGLEHIEFEAGDAQNMSSIPDQSFDFIVNIESAFHYPDKKAFLHEIARVLKPGGHFVIADILKNPSRKRRVRKLWKRNMHLNHWEKKTYERELENSKLKVENYQDITEKVIRSFKRYPLWLKTMHKKNFFHNQKMKLFYTINIRLNIRLLKKRRRYVVFSGVKAA
jgi:ubiquinone/menaquinone biosynthesis C-methylase UbiE